MAYESKVILKMIANYIVRAKDLKDAYEFVSDAANAEGVVLPGYDEAKKKLNEQTKG